MEPITTDEEISRRGLKFKALFLMIFLAVLSLCFLSGAWLGYSLQKAHLTNEPDSQAKIDPKDSQEQTPIPASFAPREVSYRFRFGDNLYSVLREYGVSDPIISEWVKAAEPFYDLVKIKAGQEFWIRYDPTGAIGQFELGINSRKNLLISRTGNGYQAELKSRNWLGEEKIAFSTRDQRLYHGEISSSFYQAGLDAGMDPGLISNLANMFFGVIDFGSQVRKGDQFWVMTELTAEGDEQALVSEIEVKQKWYQAYFYRDASGAGYYDETGHALKGFYLIRPVAGGRVSSGYSYRRYHPVLHRRIPHLAVDYAAPAGTKVRAAAGGIVTYAGWKGGYGNFIEVKHNSSYRTSYGHLKGFASGIKTGAKVKQGQVIGYVGSTGLATGSHLDYRVIRSGQNINPSRIRAEKGKPVKDLPAFNQAKQALAQEINGLKQASRAADQEATYSSLGRR